MCAYYVRGLVCIYGLCWTRYRLIAVHSYMWCYLYVGWAYIIMSVFSLVSHVLSVLIFQRVYAVVLQHFMCDMRAVAILWYVCTSSSLRSYALLVRSHYMIAFARLLYYMHCLIILHCRICHWCSLYVFKLFALWVVILCVVCVLSFIWYHRSFNARLVYYVLCVSVCCLICFF